METFKVFALVTVFLLTCWIVGRSEEYVGIMDQEVMTLEFEHGCTEAEAMAIVQRKRAKKAYIQTQSRSVLEAETYIKAKTETSTVTSQSYGSMTTPVKTITIDVYQKVDVDTEVQQKLVAEIKAKLAQLAEVKTKVKPQFEVKVRQ